jgi:hypothetical protein
MGKSVMHFENGPPICNRLIAIWVCKDAAGFAFKAVVRALIRYTNWSFSLIISSFVQLLLLSPPNNINL